MLAWFSLGVIASGVMGAGAIAGFRNLKAGATPTGGTPAVASWSYPGGEWDTVQLAIDRSQRGRAPLPVLVTGADDGAFEVVMHGLPVGVRPSGGIPVGEATWVLRRTDLDGLHLTLDERAPESFDVKLAVLTSPGMPTAGSIVQIRLVDPVVPKQPTALAGSDVPPAPLAHPLAYVGISDGPGAVAARPTPAATPDPAKAAAVRAGDKAGGQSVHRRTGPAAAGVAGQPASTARAWPEGAQGLGATPREPEGWASWWQIPPPSWSPFVVGQERP